AGRQWVTVPGQSLAFSLVFRLSPAETEYFPCLTALGALGLIRALGELGLNACLKWPNDVLLMGSKVGGVLVEANWQSGTVEAAVIGIGVNIAAGSVPPAQGLRYPATDIASALGAPVDRWVLLAQILGAMQAYRQRLTEVVFIEVWNKHLAWRGEWIRFQLPDEQPQLMRISEVMPDGQLALETRDGQKFHALSGEIIVGND
ncbi:MAG: biotin--[acetyl-CoA-carboxylase] ligase, partial [Chloroflexi bacterium]|nr:biotin--[acetyl-CoA-carboxylase] ligase [Chloroflexota bacterium]